MTVVASLTEFVREHGLAVLLGTSAVFGVVSLAMVASRSYVAKRQIARLGLLALLGYAVLALVPMPRLSFLYEVAIESAPRVPGDVRVSHTEAPGRLLGASERLGPEWDSLAPVTRPSGESSPIAVPSAMPSAAPPLAAPEPVASSPDLAEVVAWALLAAFCLVSVQLLVGWNELRRVVRGSREASSSMREALGIPRHVRLSIAGRAVSPFCCGLLRPRIVLPPELVSMSSDARFVVRHELAHLRAGDARWRMLVVLLRPLLFWQPLFWWLQGQLRFCGEVLADEAAAGGAVGNYVRSMTALAATSRPRVLGAPAAFVFHRRTELFRRLEMMLKRGNVLSSPVSQWQRLLNAASAVMLVVACGAVFGVERAVAQDPKREGQVEQLRVENAKLRTVNADLRARLELLEQNVVRKRDEFDDQLRRVDGKPVVYVVQQGDTFAKIAKDLYGKVSAVDRLRALNPGVDPIRLRVGEKLRIAGEPPPAAREKPKPAPASAPAPRAAAAPATTRRSLDDVARVTTRLIDLRGQVQIAEIQFVRLREQFEQSLCSKHDLQIAEIGMKTKRQQCEVIDKMLRIELECAQRELDRMKVLFEAGLVSSRETAPISSFVQVLLEVF